MIAFHIISFSFQATEPSAQFLCGLIAYMWPAALGVLWHRFVIQIVIHITHHLVDMAFYRPVFWAWSWDLLNLHPNISGPSLPGSFLLNNKAQLWCTSQQFFEGLMSFLRYF